jgi:hypothetical protein
MECQIGASISSERMEQFKLVRQVLQIMSLCFLVGNRQNRRHGMSFLSLSLYLQLYN